MQNRQRNNLCERTNEEKHNTIRSITISAAGDCCIGSDEKYPGADSLDDHFKKSGSKFLYVFKNVEPIFARDDLTIVNLETTLTEATGKKNKRYNFKGEPAYVNFLKEGSIEVVDIANNHIFDYFKEGYLETIKQLNKAGIKYFGSDVVRGYSYDHQLIEEVKGVKIGLLGYKCWPNPNRVINKLKIDLVQMKANCDLVILSFHWGEEFKYYPTPSQRRIAHLAVDHGADLILGHHPHVIQGIEVYKNKNIVYSLGNFCFGGQFNFKDKDTFIYQHTFTYKNSKLIRESSQVIPCSISSVKNINNSQPTPLEGSAKKRVLARIKKYSEDLTKSHSV